MTLVVKVISAYLTHDTEMFSNMDPYVILEVGNDCQKTTVKDQAGKKPIWGQVFEFKPSGTSLTTIVMDKDLTKDDVVGTGKIDLNKFIHQGAQGQQYVSLLYKGKPAGKLLLNISFTGGNQGQGAWQQPNNNSWSAPMNNSSGWGSQNSIPQNAQSAWGPNNSNNGWGPNNNGWGNSVQSPPQNQTGWGQPPQNTSGWGQPPPQNNSGWGSNNNGWGQPPPSQNNSGWGPNNNGWGSGSGSKSGW